MKKFSFRKWHKFAGGILLFLAALLFAVPRIGRSYLVNHSLQLLGRRLDIDKIRINYFTGTLKIYGLKLYEMDAKTIFVSFNRLKVNIDYFPLLKNEYYVKYIYLDDPFAEVLQNGDKFNFSDMIKPDTTGVQVKDTVPSEPAKYIINDIKITRGYLKYTDLKLNHTIAMDSLTLQIPGFTWNSDSTNLDVNFNFVDGGGLYSKLDVNQADSTYSINLKLDSLNLNILQPYAKEYLNISTLNGFLSDDLLIKGSMTSVMNLFVRGMNHIYGAQISDTAGRTIFSFSDLAIDIDSFLLDKNRIRVKSVTLSDPFILFELIDTTNNWLALMKPVAESPADSGRAASDTSSEASSFSYNFPRLRVTGGKIQFSDRTLRYPFVFNIENLNVESSESAAYPGKLDVKVSAGLNGTGTFTTEALLNPDNFNDLDLNLAIGEFRMKDVDAYFMHYFGFPVTGGIMNFKTDDQMKPSSLVSTNMLYFRKFTLGQRTDNQAKYKVPLRLALGVLSDKDGIIDLKAPVESKGNDVKVKNLGKIIFKIIGNLFVKAAVSPFNALAGGYKADPEKLQEIRLPITAASPDEENLKSVDVIADILNDKPALNIDFYYCIDRSKTSDTLAFLMAKDDYVKYVKSTGTSSVIVADSTLAKYISSRLPAGSPGGIQDIKTLCRTYIGAEKLNARIDSIISLQTTFLQAYLSSDRGIPAGRFRIISTPPDTIRPSPYYPSFRNYFTAGGE